MLYDCQMNVGEQVPKYHFKCNNCDRDWWEWLSISESNRETCPHCDGPSPQKIPVNFIKIDIPSQEKKGSKENVVSHIEENREILKKMREKAITKDVFEDD